LVVVVVVSGVLVVPWAWWTTTRGPLRTTRGAAVGVVLGAVVVVCVCVDVVGAVVVVVVVLGVVPVPVGVVVVPVLLGVVLTGASAGWPAAGPLGPVTVGA
jgi:hypothetical protein